MVPDISLGAGVPRLVYVLGTSFLLLCLFDFEVLRGCRACSVGVLHFLRFPLFPCLTLRTSMGRGRSSFLRIWSNPVEASSSGWTDGGNDGLAVVVDRAAVCLFLYRLKTPQINIVTKILTLLLHPCHF